MTETRRTVEALAEEIFELDPDELVDSAHLEDDWGATSVSLMEFLVALERTFDLEIHHADIVSAQTLGAVIAYLEVRRAGAAG